MNMYVLVFIVFSNFSGLLAETHNITKYIKRYDIVDCFVSVLRTKRNLHSRNEKLNKDAFDAEVQFKLQDKLFHLLLIQDTDFKTLKVESFLPDNSAKTETISAELFEGVLKEGSSHSHVLGYVLDSAFTGSIELNETVYFVEPANRFFSNLTNKNKIIVYEAKDLVLEGFDADHDTNENISLWAKINISFGMDILDILPKGINKTQNESVDYACVSEMVADHTLYNYFRGDIDKLTAYLYLHAKYVDFILRRTDFDGDGQRDRIRFIAGKIFIYKTENDTNYPMKTSSDMREFLNDFSYRTQNHCIALCMIYRDIDDSIIGMAFRASASKFGQPGGICQKPLLTHLFSRQSRSTNTAVINVRSKQGTLPLGSSLLAVAHEVGHSFGSDHDPMVNLLCSPGGPKGFYLMHAKAQKGTKPLTSLFSPCSKKAIASVIEARGECLKPYPATCGNGIQEGDEDCDCGKEATCELVDKCCTPSDAKAPESGCTFRKYRGAYCSPNENECCLDDCAVNKDDKFVCFNDSLSCKVSFCDGKTANCPKPQVAPDKYPCRGTSKSCSNGVCNSSVCLDNNLNDCVCKGSWFECHICCEKNGKCVTAFSLGFYASSGEYLFALEGTPCNIKRFQCDGSGQCIDQKNRNLRGATKPVSTWWAIGGLLLALIIILSVLNYFALVYVRKYLCNKD